MNARVNYSGFIDMIVNSDDEFEPYGLSSVEESLTPTSYTSLSSAEYASDYGAIDESF